MDNPSTNIHTIVKAQIVFLLSTLTDANFEHNQVEIRSLSEQHGIDTYLHFIRRLIVHSAQRLSPAGTNNPPDNSSVLTFRLLVQETQRLARDPHLADRFRDGVDKGEGEIFRTFDLVRFTDRVGLRPLEKLVLAASILSGKTRPELASQAATIVATDFEDAVMSLCTTPSFDHADLTPNGIAKLMRNLLSDPPRDSPVLDFQQRQALIVASQSKYGREVVAPILYNILPQLSLPHGATLVQTLMQLGPDVTNDPDVVRAIFARFGITDAAPPSDNQVVELIQTLGRLAAEGSTMCDVGAVVRALSSYPVQLDWPAVIRSFDWPDRLGVDTATLKLLIAVLLNSPRDAHPHAVTGFWTVWNNSLYQLRLLDALLSLPADTFNFVSLPGHRIVTVDDVSLASPTIKSLAANVQGHTWNSLDLFQVLVRLADSDSPDIKGCICDMLDKAIKISAELVHMGLLQVPNANWNEIRLEYSRKLLAMFLGGHPNHQLVFMRIWQIQPSYLTDAFRDFYEENPQNITRILDVAQDLKILEALLEVRPFTFALDVAALASRREYLNLDKWLGDKVAAHGTEFLRSIADFLKEKMESEKLTRITDPPVESRTMPINPSTVAIILRVIRGSSHLMEQADVDYALDVQNMCFQVYPRLMNLAPGADVESGLAVIQYSQEIESEVDLIYKRMYDENISIDEVITMLQQFRTSSNPRDQEVFSCMIHFLFDEYRFFQSFYPDRELAMTGYLFGSIIQHDLLDYMPLGIAVRYVIDALNCPPDKNLFRFGVQALSRFESRLPEWQPLCAELLKNQHLLEARPDLANTLQRALAMGPDGDLTELRTPGMGGYAEPAPVFLAIQPDEVDEEIETPSEELSDKILFIVNNLAPSNFDTKLVDMKQSFSDEYARWFANYLVDQRISTEPNNHSLYLRFLDALNRSSLNKYILHETFVKAAALLNSEKTVQSSTERSILKNVGSWLGTITLARDRPIKHKNLSFKDLLMEGYDSGRLIVAIPFVCKTLEPAAQSKVFRPPNPWLMAVISLLAELYHFAELKLNLKFEIEVLCKSLDIDLDTVEAAVIVRNRPMSDVGPAMPEYPGDIDALSIGGYDAAMLGEPPVMPLTEMRQVGTQIEQILTTLAQHVQISSTLSFMLGNPAFKRAVQLAVDRAVREIILPVVDRSVTIAGISTRELVAKDFATEANEEKMRKAAHSMAAKLAGSLAMVTCKEPLRTNLAQHLRQYLAEHGFSDIAAVDNHIMDLALDNLDNACSAIERAAMERAISDVDEGFQPAYEMRIHHRETRSGPFWDSSNPVHSLTTNLPDILRLHKNGVLPVQLNVYEDFTADHKRRTSRPSSTMPFNASGAYPGPATPAPLSLTAQAPSNEAVMERFGVLIRDLDNVLVQLPIQSLALLPPNHDVRHLVRQIMLNAQESDRRQAPLQMSQKIVQLLYKAPTQLGREVYVALLDQLCRHFEETGKEAINWLIYAEDERKYNIPVTVTLLRSRLFDLAVYEQQLAKFLFTDPRPSLINFVIGLIRECLTAEPPIATQSQFPYCIEVLSQIAQSDKATDEVVHFMDDLRGVRRPSLPATPDIIARQPSTKPESDQLREAGFWFQSWVQIYHRSPNPEKSFVGFITQVLKSGVLNIDEASQLFFRVCAETSVNHYAKAVAVGNYASAYSYVDAMSKLVVFIIKYHGDPTGVNADQAKVHYFKKVLSILILVLAYFHEEQEPFQQKPFFRLFSSLLNDLNSMEASLGTVYFPLLVVFCETLSGLQPIYFPGFAFSWMGLISHRLLMPKLLLSENREGWAIMQKLLIALFKFLAPFLKDSELSVPARDMYRGALRILLVLLHDFPDFLSEYYFSLCDVIPYRCIQLRNIVLSGFPQTMVLPDPHLRGMKPEVIVEMMGPIPPILSDFAAGLKGGDLKAYLDQYLLGRGSTSFLPSLKERLRISSPVEGLTETYNLSLLNALVMYIGVSSVAQAKARNGTALFAPSDPGVVALQYLANSLDAEGQFHLITSMTLHLRYPNAHTYWFCSLLLHLFTEVEDEKFQEIMTRVLLERFMVHRPHPWGAVMTFVELLRNPKYNFWSKEFINVAPEVSMLLESVSASLSGFAMSSE
ncbi:CCR4-Not complex component, Not1-domain-containing protein [Schizophyllum commune]